MSEDESASIGFAWNGIWGEGSDVEELPEGKSVQERAEVWFDRV